MVYRRTYQKPRIEAAQLWIVEEWDRKLDMTREAIHCQR